MCIIGEMTSLRYPKKASTDSSRACTEGKSNFIVFGKSGKGTLLVVVDRKSRSVFIERIIRPRIATVHAAFLTIKVRFPEMRTLTMDNDILFAKHEDLARLLRIR